MTIKIDHEQAKLNLYEAHLAVKNNKLDSTTTLWKERIDELGRLCPYRKSSTFVAAIGTAILAKTVNTKIDPYSLLDREGLENSYSARSLADNVWAKNRAYLDIDLGANGANPLNNIPFIGRDSIRGIENVRNKEGEQYLYSCLNELETIKDSDIAKAALRGFISSRLKQSSRKFTSGETAGDHFVIQTLSEAITAFIKSDSEDGRRAQAIAAALLGIAFGLENISVGHINDPDRNHPLDITVFTTPEKDEIKFSVEVKDKKITGADIISSVEKVTEFSLNNIIYLAINSEQKEKSFLREALKAKDLNCQLIIFYNWEEFCKMCFSISSISGQKIFSETYRIIGEMLVDLGVSEKGLIQWTNHQKPIMD